MPLSEIDESNALFREAWRFITERSPSGEVLELPEVSIISGNVTWPEMNAAFLPAPVDTPEVLERAVAAAARHFQPRGRRWVFVLGQDWLAPSLRPRVVEILGAYGLKPGTETIGMVADRLAPPVRPLPRLALHRVTDAEGRRKIADINARSYEMPLEVGREALDVAGLFEDDDAIGSVGDVGGDAVTCAAVYRLNGIAYVVMVATLAGYRQRGLAEAVVRHCLDEARRMWGLERTVLHATPEGFPIYLRMGYRTVTRFQFHMATQ